MHLGQFMAVSPSMYQQTRLADLAPIGSPGPIPYAVANWSDAELADLDAMKLDPSFGLAGMGFWPVVVTAATFDPARQAATDSLTVLTVDAPSRRWTATTAVRDLTADQLAAALANNQNAKSAAVDARRDAILTGGFSYDFGAPTGVKQLQTRDDRDARNWLTLQNSCTAAVMAGQGATVGAKIRTADNVNVSLSYSDGLHALLALAAWGAAVYAVSWTLKDAIAAAIDQAGLDAICTTSGWPAGS